MTSVKTIVFSKDRPLQLAAFLESFEEHWRGTKPRVEVIHESSTIRYAEAYRALAREFHDVEFTKETVFECDFRNALPGDGEPVLLAVDDTIFVQDFNLGHAWDVLDDQEIIGVSLRLSHHQRRCYPAACWQITPTLTSFSSLDPSYSGYSWKWNGADGDFGYPLEVSSSVYRAIDIRALLDGVRFQNPNELEHQLSVKAWRLGELRPRLASFGHACAFSWPANRVQNQYPNRCGQDEKYAPEALLEAFERGMRIDVQALSGFVPLGAHDENAPIKLVDR